MTTIEKLLNTIDQLKCVAELAIDLAIEYSGDDSEMAQKLEQTLQEILDEHNQDN